MNSTLSASSFCPKEAITTGVFEPPMPPAARVLRRSGRTHEKSFASVPGTRVCPVRLVI